MTYIYLCVNYDSSEQMKNSLNEWINKCNNLDIYIVDNFSSLKELAKVKNIAKKYNANLITNKNYGYGSALNIGLKKIIESGKYENEDYIFFGNVDIYPIENLSEKKIKKTKIPILNITNKEKNQNPFLKKIHKKFFWIIKYASRYKSKTLLILWIALSKILMMMPSKVIAVHGSLFCLSIGDIKKIQPIFNENVFLYCEELFYMDRVELLKKNFQKSNINFVHVGSVSTEKYFKKNRQKYFLNWCNSMKYYFDEKN